MALTESHEEEEVDFDHFDDSSFEPDVEVFAHPASSSDGHVKMNSVGSKSRLRNNFGIGNNGRPRPKWPGF